MNDIGYLDLKFQGSECEINIRTAQDWQLKNILTYAKGAINFHTKEQNPKQVIFFQSGLDLINKRLKRLGA